MNPENPKLNITPKPEKILRDKHEKIENLSFGFSGELENNHVNQDKAQKMLEIFDSINNTPLGNIYFNETENAFEIKEVVVDEKFHGQNVGINLYKELIRTAKEKGLEKIDSDNIVQGGAIAMWRKLKDEGNLVRINPKIKEKFEEFKKVYDEGKYFKEKLDVPVGEHVFELLLNDKEIKNKYSQELINVVWKRLAQEGITNADELIGTRQTIENTDFEKFWQAVKNEDIEKLITSYKENKKKQLAEFEKYKDRYNEGDFVPETGTMISQDTSWWDNKIADLETLLNKIENNHELSRGNFSNIQEVFKLKPELREVISEIFTGISTKDIVFNIEPFGKSIDNIDILSDDKKIGYVQISKNNSEKTLIVSGIELKEKGNGKKVYLKLQEKYPDYTIQSDPKNISEDAIFMWDSLVKRGLAVKTQDKEYSVKNPENEILNLYNSYLKNIFPESKYKHIGFKGVPQDFSEENKPSFYTKDIEAAKYYSGLREGTQTISAIFNFKNPLVVNAEKPAPIPIITPDGKTLGTFNDKDINEKIISAGYDGLIINRKFSTPLDGWEILSFDNNSRHILGSKKDIEDFKNWSEKK